VGSPRFIAFVVVSLVVFAGILALVMRKRTTPTPRVAVAVVALVVVAGGMIFAKVTQNAGWPWWIYYTVPAALTLVLPPLVFRFSRAELLPYLCLAFVSSPLIHVVFSFVLGWHEYLPFFHVPSWRDLVR
jgi:hypothetical protein